MGRFGDWPEPIQPVAGLGYESKLCALGALIAKFRALLPDTQLCGMHMDLSGEAKCLSSTQNQFCVLRYCLSLDKVVSSSLEAEIESLFYPSPNDTWDSTRYIVLEELHGM